MLPKIPKSKQLIYLDHAATTPVDAQVLRAMQTYWTDKFGNPSSLYQKGIEAKNALAEARKTIAQIIGARPTEIIFTGGGTESVNLAIFGVARELALKHKKRGHLITSAIEHHSVLHSFEALRAEGWKTTEVPVDRQGFIDLKKLEAAVRPDTVLISVMYGNNEIGTIQPIAEIGKWLARLNSERARKKLPRIYFHSDACQAGGALDLSVGKLGVDLMSVNGSKIYGPKQAAFLYIKSGTPVRPIIFGGGQERNLRSGTENVAGAVGLAEALKLAQQSRTKESKRLTALRDYFFKESAKKIPEIIFNGPMGSNSAKRLPNNVNISILGVEGESVLLYLDSYNIAVSTGSACTTGSPDLSHVMLALGQPAKTAKGSVRFTLGKTTTKSQIDYVLKVLPGIVAELRKTKIL